MGYCKSSLLFYEDCVWGIGKYSEDSIQNIEVRRQKSEEDKRVTLAFRTRTRTRYRYRYRKSGKDKKTSTRGNRKEEMFDYEKLDVYRLFWIVSMLTKLLASMSVVKEEPEFKF